MNGGQQNLPIKVVKKLSYLKKNPKLNHKNHDWLAAKVAHVAR